MIRASWREPNYKCHATQPDGRDRRWITWGPDQQAIRDRLEHDGWTVRSIDRYDFQAWRQRARRATEKAESSFREDGVAEWTESVWGDLKRHLFEIFNGKCAYCERKVDAPVRQVEHYRPRAAVRENPEHPGYYWLAYEPDNLLPACGSCNGAEGKATHFPINGSYTTQPDASLAQERPLLLNPFVDDPEEHLTFLPSGRVEGRTPRGETTIELCKLWLHNALRSAAQERLTTDIAIAIVNAKDLTPDALMKICMSKLEPLRKGRDEFSAALIDHLLHLSHVFEEGGAVSFEAMSTAVARNPRRKPASDQPAAASGSPTA